MQKTGCIVSRTESWLHKFKWTSDWTATKCLSSCTSLFPLTLYLIFLYPIFAKFSIFFQCLIFPLPGKKAYIYILFTLFSLVPIRKFCRLLFKVVSCWGSSCLQKFSPKNKKTKTKTPKQLILSIIPTLSCIKYFPLSEIHFTSWKRLKNKPSSN